MYIAIFFDIRRFQVIFGARPNSGFLLLVVLTQLFCAPQPIFFNFVTLACKFSTLFAPARASLRLCSALPGTDTRSGSGGGGACRRCIAQLGWGKGGCGR